MKAPANDGTASQVLSSSNTGCRRDQERNSRPACRDWRSGKRAAQLVPELIIAGIRIVWSLILAVGVRIELSAVAGDVDNLLRRHRVAAIADTRAKAPKSVNLFSLK
jgi:hypothetical protein